MANPLNVNLHTAAAASAVPVPQPAHASEINLSIHELFGVALFEEYIQDPSTKAQILARLKAEGPTTTTIDLRKIGLSLSTDLICHSLDAENKFDIRIATVIRAYFPALATLGLPLQVSKGWVETTTAVSSKTVDAKVLQQLLKDRNITYLEPAKYPSQSQRVVHASAFIYAVFEVEKQIPTKGMIEVRDTQTDSIKFTATAKWPEKAPAATAAAKK